MTKEGLGISIKGFAMDLVGVRKMEQEKTLTTVGYNIAKLAFEMLSEEIAKAPFENMYEVRINSCEEIDQKELNKVVDLALYNEHELNKELNDNLNIDGLKRISIKPIYDNKDFGLSIKVYFI